MAAIRIAVVEDNQLFIDTLNEYIDRFQREMNCDIETAVFRDGEDITEEYSADYDIILMDTILEMRIFIAPGMSLIMWMIL